MASLKDIRARIESTKNTQQITKAMKLVSAAKLRKAQNNIVNMRPYALTLRKVIADIAVTNKVSHPLMEKKEQVKNVLLVVITSDRGLCGAFNSNINKFTEAYYKENKEKLEKIDFLFIGRRGHDYFIRRDIKPIDYITKLDKDISYELASKVANRVMNDYLEGSYDEVRIIHNEFKSAISQIVVAETILPIDLGLTTFNVENETATDFAVDMIFEPAPEAIIKELLEKHFDLQVYRCMSESVAGEHGARMSAMESATNNAKEMINKLTLTYNKLRQEKITTELTEIVSGAEALK
ncbi:ATP synthase F1 subunit gamma [Bdellovibrio svalbardensis]|uniref:ATP synthase gamma chain n=1 Tax=Bdellovibrio svalbardensis TaxID=2972972 RepID=A0ABT6DDQ7_9BACT|nr:ATP synthase F1 subunit gamma [Bdellovibrio svalbardensis]MDG0814947.1 ATP synthase F1 subunit gamma [Bdellovibrio svalbardensis]